MAITFIAAATNVGSAVSNTVSVTVPASASAGQVAIAIVASDDASGNGFVTPPAGWIATGTGATGDNASNGRIDSFYRVLIAGDPGTSYIWTSSDPSGFCAGIILVYTGVSTSDPADVAGHNTGAASSNLVAPSQTPSQSGDMAIVAYEYVGGASASFPLNTTPGGTTQRAALPYSNNVNYGLWAGEQLLSGTSATGTYTATLSSPFDWSAITVLIAPAIDTIIASPSGGVFVIRTGAWS